MGQPSEVVVSLGFKLDADAYDPDASPVRLASALATEMSVEVEEEQSVDSAGVEVGTGGVDGGTGVGGDAGYSAPNGASDNGRVGGFGRINMAFGSRTRLRFTFVWSDSPSEKPSKAVLSLMEFNLNDIGVNGLDESEVSHPRCNGMVMMEKASGFHHKFPAESTRVIVHKNGTQTWFISQANGSL